MIDVLEAKQRAVPADLQADGLSLASRSMRLREEGATPQKL
jgi:hypothetical protein